MEIIEIGAVWATVEVGGRRITGVAAGTAATDAVNLGQLQAAIAGVSGGDSTPQRIGNKPPFASILPNRPSGSEAEISRHIRYC